MQVVLCDRADLPRRVLAGEVTHSLTVVALYLLEQQRELLGGGDS